MRSVVPVLLDAVVLQIDSSESRPNTEPSQYDSSTFCIWSLRDRFRDDEPGCHIRRPAGVRCSVGWAKFKRKLQQVLLLPVCDLPAQLLGQPVLPQCRQFVLPLSTGNASACLQPPLAQLLPLLKTLPLGTSLPD